MTLDIKQIVNVSRPGEPPADGDLVEIECVGGWVMQVDPKTRRISETRERFSVGDGNTRMFLRLKNLSVFLRPAEKQP